MTHRFPPAGPHWFILLVLCGCGVATGPEKTRSVPAKSPASAEPADTAQPAEVQTNKRKRSGPVRLGGGSSSEPKAVAKVTTESVVAALQPLQVLLGKWNGTSRKALLDQPEWVWDFQTDRDQPALVMTSEKGEYLRDARLTFLPDRQVYRLTAVDGKGTQRLLEGDLTEPVQDVPGDDQQLQRTFKLQLTEVTPATPGEVWQFAFAQQENNRYLVEVNRQRGSGQFTRLDTIHTQRDGTSFAVSSTDYGEKTCVISQGLGTISVSYQGRSYWVCCTGCKAAFEEDPERWVARYEEMKKMKP